MSPITRTLKKPTTSLEAAEAPENNSQQTELKVNVPRFRIPKALQKLLLLTSLPSFTNSVSFQYKE